MFGIGSTELLVILVVALIVLGPKNLAGAARTLGKFMGEFKRVSNDFQRTLNVEAAQEEFRQKERMKAEKKKAANQSDAAQTETPEKTIQPEENTPLAQALAKTKKQADSKTNDAES